MFEWLMEKYAASFEGLAHISTLFSRGVGEGTVFPNAMPSIGVALLTILVPFAISILSHFLRWESERKEDAFVALDLYVILDKVFVIRNILLSAFMIFLPPMFWEIIPNGRLWIVIVWLVGFIWLTRMIYHLYEWRTTHDTDLRFRYLETLTNENRMKVVWPSVWVAARLDDRNERRYLSIFATHIQSLLEEKKHSDALYLLEHFSESVLHRSDISLFAGEDSFFGAMLSWKQYLFEEHLIKKSAEGEVGSDEEFVFQRIVVVLDEIILTVIGELVQKKHLFWFYGAMEKHTESNSTNDEYLTYLYGDILRTYFDKAIARGGIKSTWEGFPVSWQVRVGPGTDRSKLSHVMEETLVEWLIEKVQQSTVASGKGVEKLVGQIYPELDTETVLRLFILTYAGGRANRLKTIIKRDWEFGFGDLTEDDPEAVARTFEYLLGSEWIARHISNEVLKRYKQELTAIGKTELPHEEKIRHDMLADLIATLTKKYQSLFL